MSRIKRTDLIQLGYRLELGECENCIFQGRALCGNYECSSDHGRATVQDPRRIGLLPAERLLVKRKYGGHHP